MTCLRRSRRILPVIEPAVPYHLSYSPRVIQAFATLVTGITDPNLQKQVVVAAKDMDYRLRTYPQFGEPLRDLSLEGLCQWIGAVPPLVVQYVIDEVRRQVFVGLPISLMPRLAEPD